MVPHEDWHQVVSEHLGCNHHTHYFKSTSSAHLKAHATIPWQVGCVHSQVTS